MDEPISNRQHTRDSLHRAVDYCMTAWPLAAFDAGAYVWASRPSNGPPPKGGHGDPTARIAITALEDAEGTPREPDAVAAWLCELFDVLHASLAGPDPLAPIHWRGWLPSEIRDHWHEAVDDIVNHWPTTERQVRAILRLGNRARFYWPPLPKEGTVVSGVTIGERGNATELCAYCLQWWVPSESDPGRYIDDDFFHMKAGDDHPACWWKMWRSRTERTKASAAKAAS